jgi:hypothetical protein
MDRESFWCLDRTIDLEQRDATRRPSQPAGAIFARCRFDQAGSGQLGQDTADKAGTSVYAPSDPGRIDFLTRRIAQAGHDVRRYGKLSVDRHTVTIIVTENAPVKRRHAVSPIRRHVPPRTPDPTFNLQKKETCQSRQMRQRGGA